MGIDNLGETQEAKHVNNEEPLTENQPETPPKKRSRWPVWVVVGLFGLLVIGLDQRRSGLPFGDWRPHLGRVYPDGCADPNPIRPRAARNV